MSHKFTNAKFIDKRINTMTSRIFKFIYGTACYAVFFATFLYAIGFIGNFVVPKTMDSPAEGPWQTALMIDLGLLSLFIWTLVVIVTIKYVLLVMRASNKGEGGDLALKSLALPEKFQVSLNSWVPETSLAPPRLPRRPHGRALCIETMEVIRQPLSICA